MTISPLSPGRIHGPHCTCAWNHGVPQCPGHLTLSIVHMPLCMCYCLCILISSHVDFQYGLYLNPEPNQLKLNDIWVVFRLLRYEIGSHQLCDNLPTPPSACLPTYLQIQPTIYGLLLIHEQSFEISKKCDGSKLHATLHKLDNANYTLACKVLPICHLRICWMWLMWDKQN